MSASDWAIPGARRVVHIGRATIILGNGIVLLPALAGRFQAIVSDPPYGIGYDPSSRDLDTWRDVTGIIGDDEPFDPRPLLGIVDRVALFGANHFASRLPDSARWFVWDKRPDMKPMKFADCELAWATGSGTARVIRHLWHGKARGAESGQHWHPTQKPIEVMRWIIEAVTEPGDVVLDPYMGSGSTGVAALQCGRGFIGIEIEERWFNAAETRLCREVDQGRLF